MLNATWVLDFVADALYDGRRIRCLTVLDEGNREGLEIAVGPSLPSRRVVRVLGDVVAVHGRPTAVRIDNGPEFTAQALSTGAPSTASLATTSSRGSRPRMPTSSFSRTDRTEVLKRPSFRIDLPTCTP